MISIYDNLIPKKASIFQIDAVLIKFYNSKQSLRHISYSLIYSYSLLKSVALFKHFKSGLIKLQRFMLLRPLRTNKEISPISLSYIIKIEII